MWGSGCESESYAMAMIFPGMDPYLEHPQLWPGVHNALVVYLRDQLQPRLRPRYVAAIEEPVFVEEELEVREWYIEILDLHSGKRVVTVIEVVSPANKFSGTGRRSYETKQQEVFQSTTHLVEIDLLRAGQHVVAVPEWRIRGGQPYDYLVCVNRAQGLRDWYDLYPRRLRERLPRVGIPLAGDDSDVPLDIQAGIAQVYEAGSYRDRIDYSSPCHPPLSADDQAWTSELLKQQPPSG
jgi:hypothetical protein